MLLLDDGSTDAKAFIEGGSRRRWAWLDRDSLLTSMMRAPAVRNERNAVAISAERRRAARRALRAAEATRTAEKLKKADQGAEGGSNAADDPAIKEAAAQLAAARVEEAKARAALAKAGVADRNTRGAPRGGPPHRGLHSHAVKRQPPAGNRVGRFFSR